MHRQPLPVLDPARTAFGFSRTVCACPDCTLHCRHIPGYLIPADLERIHQHLAVDADLCAWAKEHLLASPGELVVRQGLVTRIPTLVPARREDGTCIFLTDAGQCHIHPVAPFGCAFFDAHQPPSDADRCSKRGLHAVLQAWIANELYARLWLALAEAGRVAPAPEVARRQLGQVAIPSSRRNPPP
jgi:hypothetical protein